MLGESRTRWSSRALATSSASSLGRRLQALDVLGILGYDHVEADGVPDQMLRAMVAESGSLPNVASIVYAALWVSFPYLFDRR